MSLTEAAAHLRKAQGTLPTGLSQPPQHLPRAGQALRTGLDLLATHTGPDGDPLSRHGLALESDELRSAVLARVMPLAATTGDLAARLATATNGSAFPRRVDALTEAHRKLHAAAEQAQILSARSRAEGYDRALDLLAPASR
ncbi:hypothetical protein ACFQ0M_48645 [Kitasatospora aburaviensis]